jgi:hypothetical protein
MHVRLRRVWTLTTGQEPAKAQVSGTDGGGYQVVATPRRARHIGVDSGVAGPTGHRHAGVDEVHVVRRPVLRAYQLSPRVRCGGAVLRDPRCRGLHGARVGRRVRRRQRAAGTADADRAGRRHRRPNRGRSRRGDLSRQRRVRCPRRCGSSAPGARRQAASGAASLGGPGGGARSWRAPGAADLRHGRGGVRKQPVTCRSDHRLTRPRTEMTARPSRSGPTSRSAISMTCPGPVRGSEAGARSSEVALCTLYHSASPHPGCGPLTSRGRYPGAVVAVPGAAIAGGIPAAEVSPFASSCLRAVAQIGTGCRAIRNAQCEIVPIQLDRATNLLP